LDWRLSTSLIPQSREEATSMDTAEFIIFAISIIVIGAISWHAFRWTNAAYAL
jgi:hypothetical protein